MEIEIKARVDDAPALKHKFEDIGVAFSEPYTQDDTVYVEKMGALDVFLANKVFVRIRIQDGSKVTLTAKKSKSLAGDESLIKREHETEVDSAEEMREILQMMGYIEAVRVKKTRQKGKYKEYEICLDEIEGLGSFVELERIASEGEASQIQKEMIDFLLSLGIPADNKVSKGYDILMLELTGSFAGK